MSYSYAIIPKPADITFDAGIFQLTSETMIIFDFLNEWNAKYLQQLLRLPTVIENTIQVNASLMKNVIQIYLNPDLKKLGDEGYLLTVEKNKVSLSALTSRGIFYAIQSFRQLLPIDSERSEPVSNPRWIIPCCKIMDKPRFPWRGYMLDEGRHFHGTENIKRSLDLMALQKLNVLHWHITEDQGWRIEINGYPKLTEIGSRRPGTAVSIRGMLKGEHNHIPHGGFYTQQEIKDIVVYATQRNITIVPEIEIPGHSMAALSAYPELSCTGGPFNIPTGFGIYKDIYCAGKEHTFEFIKIVLEEIMTLFPSPIIHIGGDEAPTTRWKKCPDCQRYIQTMGLAGENELRLDFIKKVFNFLHLSGRQVMGWNEIIHDELHQNAIIQYWIGSKKQLYEAVRIGNQVVISAYLDMYLDHSYGLTPLKRAYNFDPVFNILRDYSKNIIGLEAPMWTEWVPNQGRLDYQTYPRLTAYAETGWTPLDKKNYPDFKVRLEKFNQRLAIMGVKFAKKEEWDPPILQQLFGLLTIAKAQTRTSD